MLAPSNETVLAVDLGTTWCKTAYFDPAGNVLAQGRAYSRFSSGYGVDAAALEVIWDAVVAAIRQATARAQSAGVSPPAAIAISCRGGNGAWLDRNDAPIGVPEGVPRPSVAETAEVYAAPVWGEDGPFAYAYAPLGIARLRWLRRTFPDRWKRIARVVALHDWIVHRLCGLWATDPATGPGYHSLLPEAAALCDLPLAAFPPTHDFDEPLGPLTFDAARALGLPTGTMVVCGCHDGVAANLGAGAITPGDACITLGSSLVLRVVSATNSPVAFGYPIGRDRWAWVRGVHGVAAQLDAVVASIDNEPPPVGPERHQVWGTPARAAAIGAGSLRLPVLPLGSEERQCEIACQALSQGMSKGAVYRAVLEGAASALRGLVEVAREDGVLPQRFIVTGAMTANSLLVEILSAVLASPLEIADPEAGVRGAAILAARGAGWYADIDEAMGHMTVDGEKVAATHGAVAAYAEWLQGQPLARGTAPRRAAWDGRMLQSPSSCLSPERQLNESL